VATAVTAIDAAPEMIDIARGRVAATNVRFEVAEVFSWQAPARFDTVFVAFWLSHVPASRFEQFWRQLRGLVAEQGRVLLVDEHADVRGKEAYAEGSGEMGPAAASRRFQAPPGQSLRPSRPAVSPAAPARLAEPHPPGRP